MRFPWAAGPSISPLGIGGAADYRGSIYLFSGESQARGIVLDEIWRLDDAETAWMAESAMRTARNFARAVVFRDSVWIIGGSPEPVRSHASPGLDTVEVFHLECPN